MQVLCDQGVLQFVEGQESKALLVSEVVSSLNFMSFPPRMQRIRSKQQKYRDGHQTSEESQQSPSTGRRWLPNPLFKPSAAQRKSEVINDSYERTPLMENPL